MTYKYLLTYLYRNVGNYLVTDQKSIWRPSTSTISERFPYSVDKAIKEYNGS